MDDMDDLENWANFGLTDYFASLPHHSAVCDAAAKLLDAEIDSPIHGLLLSVFYEGMRRAFCINCGEEMPHICPSCGESNK